MEFEEKKEKFEGKTQGIFYLGKRNFLFDFLILFFHLKKHEFYTK